MSIVVTRMCPHWEYRAMPPGNRVVSAWTKGEARARFKEMLGVDRLPVGAVVTRRPSRAS